jgi:hypothetical protein
MVDRSGLKDGVRTNDGEEGAASWVAVLRNADSEEGAGILRG